MKEIMMLKGMGYVLGIVAGMMFLMVVKLMSLANKKVDDLTKDSDSQNVLFLFHKGVNKALASLKWLMNITI